MSLSRALPRLPPGQQLAAAHKWPLVGERTAAPGAPAWELEVFGCVEQPRAWSLSDLAELPQVERLIDIHCVTRWSKLDMRFGGVDLGVLLAASRPSAAAQFVSFVARSDRSHSTSLVLDEALSLGTIVATSHAGEPLSAEHGGPIRAIVPRRYFYKSLKWLTRIELLERDRPGYWEAAALYHNHADPWHEERYAAPEIDRTLAARIAREGRVAGLNLTGLDLSGQKLPGFQAQDAILRDARFNACDFIGASFVGANLSNAQFHAALLSGADFQGADLEGADFTAADLRGANLRAVSLLGVTFFDPRFDERAQMDRTTSFAPERLDDLAPAQLEFVLARLKA